MRRSLAKPPLGQADFCVRIHVELGEPIPSDDPKEAPWLGYYRNYGVRGAPSELVSVVEAEVTDGVVDGSDCEHWSVDPSSLERTIKKRITGVSPDGIWYESGRVFYEDPEIADDPN